MAQAASGDFANPLAAWFLSKMRRMDRHLFDSYHPELHYMRGPGPKWREKHGQLPARAEPGSAGLRNAGA